MQIKYRFYLDANLVNPSWSGDLSKVFEPEGDEQFLRGNISSKFVFLRDDFNIINDASFANKFAFYIQKTDSSGVYQDYWEGSFYKTDCEIDEDNLKATVTPKLEDDYNLVIEGIEKEFNLIDLVPPKTDVAFDKRPILQAYVSGENTVFCYLDGEAWEQETLFSETDPNILYADYFFLPTGGFQQWTLYPSSSPTPSDLKGEFVGRSWYTLSLHIFYNKEGDYKIYRVGSKYVINEIDTDTDLFETIDYPIGVGNATGVVFSAISGSGASGSYSANVVESVVYARWLTNELKVENLNSTTSYSSLLSADDIVGDNRNYKRAIPSEWDRYYIHLRSQSLETKFGESTTEDLYYVPPDAGTTYEKDDTTNYYPFSRTKWTESSIWFKLALGDDDYILSANSVTINRDSYKISDVIAALLAVIDSTIDHENTSTYSQFLYATTNPVTSATNPTILFTAKSNVIYSNYDQPAEKAMIMLSDVFEFLKNTYECFWYIDDGKLKIEHISWFKNGGTYSPSPIYNTDLTTLIQPKNQKTWGLYTSSYKYDKQELYERKEFRWMDSVKLSFEGYPINAVSDYVQKGNVQKVELTRFTSDVDFILLSPGLVNQEGFVAFAAFLDDTNLFDSSAADVELGYVVSALDGTTAPKVGTNTSGYIRVTEDIFYYFGYFTYFAWYDETKTYISGSSFVINSDHVKKAPEGAYYLRVSSILAWWAFLEILLGKNENGTYKLPYLDFTFDGKDISMQNGYLSFLYLHLNFFTDDLPGEDVTINNTATTADGIRRSKKQTVTYPSFDDPDPLKLVKTALGDGQIEKLRVNLSSRMNEIDLKYDTE